MPTTGYNANKDEHGLAQEREKRAREQQEQVRKRHVAADLASKENFLSSTKHTIEMKLSVMKGKEIRERMLEGEIAAIETKEKILESKEKSASDTRAQQLAKELATTEAEIIKVRRELETEKQLLAKLEREDAELKRKKEAPQGNEGASVRAEITVLERQKLQKTRDAEVAKREHDELKRQIDQLERDKAKLEMEVRRLEMQPH